MKKLLPKFGKIPLIHKVAVGGVGLVAIVCLARRLKLFRGKVALVVLIGILVVVVLLLVLNLIMKWREKKKSQAFGEELSESERESKVSKAEVRRALDELGQRWVAAVEELRSSGLSLYSMPWYMLFGEPQSGKSTTLKNSGLEFPVGTHALSGAGGTRNCDWWFTNEAIVLDTAGRFSFQEKNAPDQEEWRAFLDLLGKHRRNCPINGVVVVVPCTSLLGDTPEQIEEKASNIRNKLGEIQQVLGIRFPVFLLVTKCDIILGFTEFFTNLDAGERRQILGWSTPGRFDERFDPRKFSEVFDELSGKVHQWRMKFLLDEISTREVDKLFVFPEEFGSLKKPLQQYVDTVFVQTRYTQPLFFRGVYFTSGLQQGRPIARACADLLRAGGGAAEEVVENLEDTFQTSRAFFIRDFYREKVFREQRLVVRSEQALKRDRLIKRLVWIGGGAIAAVTIALVIWGLINLQNALTPLENSAENAVQILKGEKPDDESLRIASLRIAEDLSKGRAGVPKVLTLTMIERRRLMNDVKEIHGALYSKKCLEPLVEDSERGLRSGATVQQRPEEFAAALKEYIRWWVASRSPDKKLLTEDGKSILKVEPFVELAWADTVTGQTLAEEFAVFVEQENGDPTTTLRERALDEVLLLALDSYKQQWDIRAATTWWTDLMDCVEKTHGAYRATLALGSDQGDSKDNVRRFRGQADIFAEQIRNIEARIQQLNDDPALKQAARTEKELESDASTSYDELIEIARAYDEDSSSEIKPLLEKLNGHKEDVLKSIAEDYQSFVGDRLKKYPHIINKVDSSSSEAPQEGQIVQLTGEAEDINRFLNRVRAFVSIEDDSLEAWAREIPGAVREHRGAGLFDEWHGKQESERDNVLREVMTGDLADQRLHPNWELDTFQSAMRLVGASALVERDVVALERYIDGLESHYRDLAKASADRVTGEFKLASCKETVDDVDELRNKIGLWIPARRARDVLGKLHNTQLGYLGKVFDSDWSALIGRHEEGLTGKFPFAENLECAETGDIEDFLGELGKLRKVCEPYEKDYDLLGGEAGRKKFVQNCEGLRELLFDEGYEKRGIRIDRIELSKEIGQHYTKVELKLVPVRNLEFYPAGGRRTLTGIEWKPGAATDELRLEGTVGERTVENPKNPICKGSLSLLAFVVVEGKTDDRRQWDVSFEVPNPKDADSIVAGRLMFVFSQKLPELPDWKMTR